MKQEGEDNSSQKDATIVGNKDIVKWTVGSYQQMLLSGRQSTKVAIRKQMSMWKPERNTFLYTVVTHPVCKIFTDDE